MKLPYLEIENDKRRSIARRYLSEIKNDKIILPLWDLSDNHVFHLFVIRTNNRQELQDYLLKNGVQTAIHYPIPPHKQKALQQYHELTFPITEKMHDEVLTIPLDPVLSGEQVDFIIRALNGF